MSRIDTSAILAKEMASIVQRHVAEAVAPLVAKIKELESRPIAKDGRDGISVSGGLINEDGILILTLSDGALKEAGRVRGKDAAPVDYEKLKSFAEEAASRLPKAKDGDPGKDADPDLVERMVSERVSEAVAALPKPENGKDADPAIIDKHIKDGFAAAMPVLKQQAYEVVGQALTDLKTDAQKHINQSASIIPDLVKTATAEAVAKLPVPKDGKDGEGIKEFDTELIEDGRTLRLKVGIGDTMHKHDIPLPVAKDGRDGLSGKDGAPGRDGIDGKSVTVDEVAPLIASEVQKAFSGFPVPKDGRDGQDGKSFTLEDAAPLIEQITQKAGSLIPAPKDGRDGIDGKDGLAGERGEKGADGRDGKDADPVEIVKLLVPEVEKRFIENPVFKGPKGDPGRDGRDGAPGGPPGPQGEKGEPGKSIIYRGVYEAGMSAKDGEAVTFGGSLWIANQDTSEKPGESPAWRLAVKRGRDGKDPR
jgi:hypothetical protein